MEGEESSDNSIYGQPRGQPRESVNTCGSPQSLGVDAKEKEEEESDGELLFGVPPDSGHTNPGPARGGEPVIKVQVQVQVDSPVPRPVTRSDPHEGEVSPLTRGAVDNAIIFLQNNDHDREEKRPEEKRPIIEKYGSKAHVQSESDSVKYSSKSSHVRAESDSIIAVTEPKSVKKRTGMEISGSPKKAASGSSLNILHSEKEKVPFDNEKVPKGSILDNEGLEIREKLSNRVVQAFSAMAVLHTLCAMLFAVNIYFLPLYYLKDIDSEVGKITFQKVEVYCEECSETSNLNSWSYLDICGIGVEDESMTNGFIRDYTTAAMMSSIALFLSVGNLGLLGIILCFLLGKRLTDKIPQALILFSGLVSLGQLLFGLIVPLLTQLGTWNRDKVDNIFKIAAFECDSLVSVYSSYGFLVVWIVLTFTIADMALAQRLVTLVRML